MGFLDFFFGSKKTFGSITTTEGTYEGDLVNDKPNGKGVFCFHGGGRYEGDFRKGTFTGKGTMSYVVPTAGYHYEGDFVNGKRHGKGIYTFPSGKRYEGDFVDNDIHGYGVMYAEDGSIEHQGQWSHYQFIGNR